MVAMRRVKYAQFFCPAILAVLLLTSACENDLNKVRAIAAADSTQAVDRTTGLEVIFSDSAKVKLKLNAPLSLDFKGKKEYTLMPKGVKVVFYNEKLEPIGTIVADTGIRREKLIEFHKNVVATNPEGSVFRSNELLWDQSKKQIYSNKPITMTKVGGDILNGSSFVSDEKLLHPVFQNSTAVIHVNESLTQ